MPLLLLLYVALFVIGSSAAGAPELPSYLPCGVPFGLRNETRQTITALQAGEIDPGSLATTDIFLGKDVGPEPWPRGMGDYARIWYCFRTPQDRAALHDKFEAGLALWSKALGGWAPGSRHAIRWEERLQASQPLYCHDEKAKNGFEWNEQIPYETIAVMAHENPVAIASATIGYIVNEDDPEPWEMIMRVGQQADDAAIAHEQGHLMGLAHEHQAPNRDDYVYYNCTNMRDYDDAFRRAEKDNPSFPKDKLKEKVCTDWYYAFRYEFAGTEYIAGHSSGGWSRAWTTRVVPGFQYDIESLMHYYTLQTVNKEGCATNQLDKCALVKLKSGKDKPWEKQVIQKPTKPSQADVEWIRYTYPFPW